MKKTIFIITVFFALVQSANAQTDFRSKYGIQSLPILKIGDQVPDAIIPKLINSTSKSVKISDFKNQLLVVEFWATWCGGCIAALPNMEKLQKQFGDKVMMLPVTYEKEDHVALFWKQNAFVKRLSLPTVVEDKILLSYFAHKAISHDAWIYKGKVIAITAPDYLTAGNVEKVLSGAIINWPVKDDFPVFNGFNQQLFKIDSNQVSQKTSIKYSAISGYKDNVGHAYFGKWNGIARDSIKTTIRDFEVNIPIFNLYDVHFTLAGLKNSLVRPNNSGTPNEVIWEVSNKYKYIENPKLPFEDWSRKYAICFESLNPDTGQTDQDVSKTVIADLNRLLGLNVRWEKRKEQVLVLRRTSKDDKLKSKTKIVASGIAHGDTEFRYIHAGTLHQFRDSFLPIANYMNQQATNPYVFDETGYTDKVDMDLNIPSWTDIAAIRKAISPYGLALKEEERLVDKFVFSEVNGGLLVDVEMQKDAKAKREAQKGMKAPTPDEGNAFMAANKKKAGVVTLPSGVQYKIIEKGGGVKPGVGEKVILHQTAMLVNGLIFYNTKEDGRPGDPMSLDGEWEKVKGLQEALKLMSVGDKWEIYLPAELAYGGASANGRIPANSAVIYQVELLGVEKL